MVDVFHEMEPESARFLAGTTAPRVVQIVGAEFPFYGLVFPDGVTSQAYWPFRSARYPGSKNVVIEIDWWALGSVSGGVVWDARFGALTPDADDVNVQSKTLGSSLAQVTDNHLGGASAQRLHRAIITISGAGTNAMADGDWCALRLRRLGADAADNIASDVGVALVTLRYDDGT